MATTSQFDLNASLDLWLGRLTQSPHFRKENVAEMEAHVRDSVTKLHSRGLSEEESFLIAIRRVGSVGKLEPEFAKVNRNLWNMIIHGVILAFFSIACWFLWGMTQSPRAVVNVPSGTPLTAFTRLVMELGKFLWVPPLLAASYCMYVWLRKSKGNSSWMSFFATTAAVLVLLTPPIVVAILITVVEALNRSVSK